MVFTDQIGHTFEITTTPKRIISVVPSQTELLYDFGLEDSVVGITKFCVHPNEWFRTKNRVGGTKNLSLDKIAALKPDLIIANKEENTQSEIEELQKLYPVYTSDISNLKESLEMIKDIGFLTNVEEKANSLISEIKQQFEKLSNNKPENKRALYFIWIKPYMSVNKERFINDMMERCGFDNVITSSEDYPEVTVQDIQKANPDFILLSSEPFPFKEKHIQEFKDICPNAEILLVDGEYFSWYGSRLVGAPEYFMSLMS